jgi:hypothetical protein
MRGRQRNAAQPSPRKLASPPGRKRALRRLGAGIEEKLLLNGVRRTGWCPMTATSPGTPLIVIVGARHLIFVGHGHGTGQGGTKRPSSPRPSKSGHRCQRVARSMHHGIEAIDHVRPLDSIAARTQQGGHAEPHGERVCLVGVVGELVGDVLAPGSHARGCRRRPGQQGAPRRATFRSINLRCGIVWLRPACGCHRTSAGW